MALNKFFVKNDSYYRGVVYEWNLPTGHTCPFALECLVKADRETGKQENKSNQYKCYAVSAERYPAVRNIRWNNFDYIKAGNKPAIYKSMRNVRIHASGDFFNQEYFDMWIEVCRANPNVNFWAFTKSLKYWIKRIDLIPDNLVLTASYGGRNDELIKEYNLKHCIVIKSLDDIDGLPVDYNDDEARKKEGNFYLLDNHINHYK